ncbi:putative L-type lectin-domain containing receptor kinase IV.1 [Iris pallida]|uniref:non-specific serine/threonine protein kinase n=1 Tax=Iris pallida TaxID=29817 RepID=A0AAX6IIZ5_IRIPA|nr:putative L-type lectin-domain containing receptor kinase IV.1 [Iris pallida]
MFFWPNMQKLLLPSIFLGTLLIISSFQTFATCSNDGFTFNGFAGANLSLDGLASITSDGLLQLTNTTKVMKGHAFHPAPLPFKSRAGRPRSFSTTFAFAIVSAYPDFSGHGIAFLLSPTTDFSAALAGQYLGLFNSNNNGNSSNHVFAVELDTIQSSEFQDIDDNHVGVDVNSLRSVYSHTAGYYDSGSFRNLTLHSGQPMQVWIDFGGEDMRLNVTLSPLRTPKPSRPLLSSTVDLSAVLLDSMYVGFSSSTGSIRTSHYVLGWSFKMDGVAEPLDYSKLPPLPPRSDITKSKRKWKGLVIWSLASFCVVLMVVAAVVLLLLRRNRYAELVEEWEHEYGPHHFSYRDLYRATRGFKDEELVGLGGFGRVYRGVLPTSNMEVAVKRVSHESRQGMKEFVAEIVSIGQLRHRNVVQLFGYCRRKGELLLVYDFMPNGSLDKLLHDPTQPALDWARRFQVIKGVASGLLYLHEDWERVVVHRDIKASNVLLDGEMNGKLGDFGLARLYDHGTDPHTTHVVGTMGYLAPEAARTGKATTKTDVFAFGAFLLEVACGRRPVEPAAEGDLVLVDWVLEHWKRGSVLATRDPRLGEEYPAEEVELVLTLGLLCSHPLPEARPSMRQVMQYLDGSAALPELSPTYMSPSILPLKRTEWLDDYILSFPSSVATVSTCSVSEGR